VETKINSTNAELEIFDRKGNKLSFDDIFSRDKTVEPHNWFLAQPRASQTAEAREQWLKRIGLKE